ncbi:MAG: hypothetical protein JXB14_08115, partial [Candidatus Altiarchaeota archaeon]|nr:hypothetical protein [Candidatus Altiarchaeota archaeon]
MMKTSIVLCALMLAGSVAAVQIPYDEYYTALREIEGLEQQAEQYRENGEYGKAYATQEEARSRTIALETSDL